ncbi:unnamed protein product [Mycena citricolor]|uniref:RRM domain-containing protein n=1 Tax=Mycena citricolor TaxID=2018698 RepID=A0AAD2GXS9_9AGAR|nr:unnamed protein product [Mycena citricolor]CAK5280610.1 unnamed protein product [Mycena citricolor]
MGTRNIDHSASVFEVDDPPYTSAEDDPFNVRTLFTQPRRRRHSMLNKWIREQQTLPTDVTEADVVDLQEGPSVLPGPAPPSSRYLAYPELGKFTYNESAVSINSYDLLEDDDIPPSDKDPSNIVPPTSPNRLSASLRHLSLSFRSSSPIGSRASSLAMPRTPSRGLFYPRNSRSSSESMHHGRTASLSTLKALSGDPSSFTPPPSASKSRWRPSVLGHFGMSSPPSPSQASVSDTLHRSRPSISSNHTYTSTTQTTTDGDLPVTPPRSTVADSVRVKSQSGLRLAEDASTFSLWSGPSYLDELGTLSRSPRNPGSTMSCDGYIGMPPRRPLGPKPGTRLGFDSNLVASAPARHAKQENRPEIAYSSVGKTRSVPRVSFASLGPRKKKKRLVISGIAAEDDHKFEAAKRWCESFGEVSQITRMPNDDLHVHFRQAEVADTVCRLRAKVYIRAVGSVQLSWYTSSENSR